MAWTADEISVRVIDKHEAVIRKVLGERFPDIRFVDSAAGANGLKVLMSFRPPEDEPLEAYDWVHAVGAGVDHLCAALADPQAAPVITRTTGRMGEQIGEYCLAYALADLQAMPARRQLQDDRAWNKDAATPRYLFDTSVAVIGTGSIGSGIARAFKALGAAVTGYSLSGRDKPGFDSVQPLSGFAASDRFDILILALPATQDTDRIVDGAVLGQLDGALLINAGRGSTLDHDALRDAFEAGQVRHAVLDVFETEPLPADDWRWTHPQVTVTPHISGLTLPDDAANRFSELLRRFLETGERPESVDVSRGY